MIFILVTAQEFSICIKEMKSSSLLGHEYVQSVQIVLESTVGGISLKNVVVIESSCKFM